MRCYPSPTRELTRAFVSAPPANHRRQSIFWSISNDAGRTWDKPQVVVASEDLPLWSPVVHAEAGRLWLFYSMSSPYCEYYDKRKKKLRHSPGGDILYVASDDNGHSWTFPAHILRYSDEHERGVPKVIANKLAVLHDGSWVLPFWRGPAIGCPVDKSSTPPSEWVNGTAGVLRTGNQGLSWKAHGNFAAQGTWLIENSVVQLDSRVLVQLFRSKAGVMYRHHSFDLGVTWTRPAKTFLPNPNSKLHVERLPNGQLICMYNHSPKKRTPLSLAISKDGGVNWKTILHVEEDPGLQFAYPTMHIMEQEMRLLVVYSVMVKRGRKLKCLGMKMADIDVRRLMA